MDNSNNSIGTLIGRAFRVLKYDVQKEFSKLGYRLTLEQWVLLVILKNINGITQHDISKIIGKDKTTITRLIDGLVNKEYILRIQDEHDRRNNQIFLTDIGKKAENILTPIAIKTNNKALKGFSEKEVELFISLLNKLILNFFD